MSSRVNLSLLVDHINDLPKQYFYDEHEYSFDSDIPFDEIANDDVHLDPNLKFKILYGGSTCEAPAKITEHVPSSFFSLEMSAAQLKSLDDITPLHEKVHSIFKRRLGIFAGILQCSTVEVHESLFYNILPFLWGGDVLKGILNDVVTYVGSLLSEPKIEALSIVE